MRPSPFRCKATFTLVRFCFKMKMILVILVFPLCFKPAFHCLRQATDRKSFISNESSAGSCVEFRSYADVHSYYTTKSVCYATIHAHCSIMLHKTINKIYIPLLLKTQFKPPSSVCNNFLLLSNVCFGCVAEIKYVITP